MANLLEFKLEKDAGMSALFTQTNHAKDKTPLQITVGSSKHPGFFNYNMLTGRPSLKITKFSITDEDIQKSTSGRDMLSPAPKRVVDLLLKNAMKLELEG